MCLCLGVSVCVTPLMRYPWRACECTPRDITETETETDTDTDTDTDDTQTHAQTKTQTQTHTQTHTYTDRRTDRHTDRHTATNYCPWPFVAQGFRRRRE